MSELRRRLHPTPSENENEKETETETETPTSPAREESPVKVVEHVKVIEPLVKPATRKRRNTAIFLLGSLFGLIAAGFFAKSNDLIEFPELGEFSVDSLLDVLPAGLVADMRDLVVSLCCCLLNWNWKWNFAIVVAAPVSNSDPNRKENASSPIATTLSLSACKLDRKA